MWKTLKAENLLNKFQLIASLILYNLDNLKHLERIDMSYHVLSPIKMGCYN